jgi:hypothetical protein
VDEFESKFPILLDGARLRCKSVNPNNSSVVIQLELLDDQGEVRYAAEQEFQLWQKDLRKPGPLLKRVKESAQRLDLEALDEVRDLFLVYPKFKVLKRGLDLPKLMKAIRKTPENGVRGIAGPPRVTRFWPHEAQTVLSLARLFEHLEYSKLERFVADYPGEEAEVQRAALEEAGCSQMLAALDAVLRGGAPGPEFKERSVLETEVTPCLERYLETHAAVLFGEG